MSTSFVRCLVLGLAWLLFVTARASADDDKEGVLPTDAEGHPLNLDFETGTLKDWTAEGEAFKGQPTHLDRGLSNKQGQAWIGGYEVLQDQPQGKLTSVPFKVTHPWASFLIGGGRNDVRVEIVLKESGKGIFNASGLEQEAMGMVAVDLQPYKDKEIFIRITDENSGGWGHINFDNFRFHSKKPAAPQTAPTGAADQYEFAGLTPEEAAKAMTVPDGFRAQLFAGEPDVKQPIAMAFDDRGRLWIAEAYAYPIRQPEGKGEDRILIFEDVDGDGKFDKRTVFAENLNLVSGIELGYGGVFVGAAPNFISFPTPMATTSRTDRRKCCSTAGATATLTKRLMLSTGDPMAGCMAATACLRIRASASPARPTTSACRSTAPCGAIIRRAHEFEIFAHGTSNPWGVDFNDHGDTFLTACVIPHLFYIDPKRAATNGKAASTTTALPTKTSRRSPTTAITSAAIPTAATIVRIPPAVATPMPAPWFTWAEAGPRSIAIRSS